MDVASAIQAIIEVGLVPVIEYTPSGSVPAGSIIPGSQSPLGGTVVSPGTQGALVSFEVSTGASAAMGNVTVPNVVGQNAFLAQGLLAAMGLSLGKYLWVVSSAAQGTVTAQSPAANASVSAGTIVTLTLSQGPAAPSDAVSVPSVS